ncbi:replication factor C 3 [Ramicandelaber brevisporus]|nr:replication factor C 3 [Ramicandelaber brevisporus]
MLWIDKHRPKSLTTLSYHPSLTASFKELAASPNMPHLLVYGPSGAGKKTRIHALLREIYGPGADRIKVEPRVFTTPSNRKLELGVITSNYHLELNPSDLESYDRVVIQDLVKEAAQTQQVDSKATRKFKVLVIYEADLLTLDAQHALRRTMEKYMANLRIILCASSTGRIIAPIRSRCLLARVAAPSVDDICTVLHDVADKESIELPSAFAKLIAEQSGRNLRRALLALETCRVQMYPFPTNVDAATINIPVPDWEQYIVHIAQYMLHTQSAQQLLQVRSKIYDLLTHCIPATVILRYLAFELAKKVDAEMRAEIIKQAAIYEHRLHLGKKDIFHLDAFVAKFMSIYKNYLSELDGIF